MHKSFLMAEVKATKAEDPTGEFEAILSAGTLDRDGEIIDPGAFATKGLPDTIPVHAFHDFTDPVGVAKPYYEGDVLKVKGYFASTARAQEIRTLVTEGVIGSMSVGFMGASRETKDGVDHITEAEILEGSFVSVPSNREAAVLVAKQYEAKIGARNSASDVARIQGAHDLFVELGAKCVEADDDKTYGPGGIVIPRSVVVNGGTNSADIVAAINKGWMTPDEVRKAEGLPPAPDTKSPDTDPEPPPPAAAPADVTVDRLRLATAEAEAALALLT